MGAPAERTPPSCRSRLAAANHQLDREPARLDYSRPRVLGKDTAGSASTDAPDAAHAAVGAADLDLGATELEPDHPRDPAAHRWRRRGWWRRRRRWRRWRRWRGRWGGWGRRGRWGRGWRRWRPAAVVGGKGVHEAVPEVIVRHVIDATARRPVADRDDRGIGGTGHQRLGGCDVPDQRG